MYLNANNRSLQLSLAPNSWPTGLNGNSVKTGSQYNDVYYSGAAETLAGLDGDDSYYLFSNAPTVLEGFGQGIDTIVSHVWGTIVLPDNVENLILDMIGATGGIGNNLDNIIIAGNHAATLWSRGGDDVLVSGKGGDVFKIVAGDGSDTIIGFQHGWDAVKLEGYGIKSFAELTSLATQRSGDVVIQLSSSETLVLRDTKLVDLRAADFNFLDHMEVQSGNVHMTSAAQVYFSNGWFVLNNTWGSGALTFGVDYTIESTFASADMTGGTTFNWSYPVLANFSTPILAYAQVSFGHTPHGLSPNPYATPGVFPLSLKRVIDIELNHDFSINGNTSGFNVAYDVWFTDRPYGDRNDVTTELMIWVHQGSVEPFGQLVGTYGSEGFSANIYNTGNYVAVVLNEDFLRGTIDLGQLIEHLIALGIMDRSEYLASIDLGAEVVSGSGGYTINDLDFSISRIGDNGGTEIVSVDGRTTTITDVPLVTNPGAPVVETPDVPAAPTPYVPALPTASVPVQPDPVDGVTPDLPAAHALYDSDLGVSVYAGTNASETIYGNASNDRLSGGGGDDHINGGAGIDTATFGGRMNQFSLSPNGANGITVVDLRAGSPEGTDTLIGIERLSFTDGTLAFDFGGTAGQAYRIYQAAFARTPDNDGLEFWIDEMDGGMDLQEVSERFVDSAEFKALYARDSIEEYVNGLYHNVLGRSGEDVGVAFWVDEISSGHRNSAKALADFSESSENVIGVAPAIDDGIWYS